MRSNPNTLEQASTRAAFFISGFVIAVWAPIAAAGAAIRIR